MPGEAVPEVHPLEQVVDARPLLQDCLDQLLAERGLAPSQRLEEFRALADSFLPLDARLTLVRQALVLMRDLYANRPLKEALQAAQPVRRLELLALELERLERRQREEDLPSELEFHREMTEIFTSVHDRHTRYLLPETFADCWALLGFDVEVFYDHSVVDPSRVVGEIRLDREPRDGGRVLEEIRLSNVAGRAHRRRYMATRLIAGLADALPDAVGFRPGVEIVSWNGVPIERAVELNGDHHTGANRAARHARGVTRLTTRPLRISPLPDEEEWVMIGYRPSRSSDEVRYLVLEWCVVSLARTVRFHDVVETIHRQTLPEGPVIEEIRLHAGDFDDSTDDEAVAVGGLRQELWKGASGVAKPDEAWVRGVDQSRMPDVLQARSIQPAGSDGRDKVGYIRLYTFAVDPDELVEEFCRLLRYFRDVHKARGLILDVRDNGGGRIPAGERLLQTLTPRRIEPERFEFLSNPTTFELCCRNASLKPWSDALELSLDLGAQYSGSFHISSPERCNDVGQVFFEPVVLIVNALSYSTTDVLTAGFQDHGIGPILATDDNVGAGGANTVSHADLLALFHGGRTLEPLPYGAGMKIALRRALRVGERIGRPLEEVGIQPDARHYMTAGDLLHHNTDLIRRAVEVLRSQPRLKVKDWERQNNGDVLVGTDLVGTDQDASRVEAHWSRATTRPIRRGETRAEPPTRLHVEGFDGDRLVTNHAVDLYPRLELCVDWWVDYWVSLHSQADPRRGPMDPHHELPEAGFKDALDAMGKFGLHKLNELAPGPAHTRSFRQRVSEYPWHRRKPEHRVTAGEADRLCAALHAGESRFLEDIWPSRRRRLEQEADWLKENFLPSQGLAIADVMRSLDLKIPPHRRRQSPTGIRITVYLASERLRGWWILTSDPACFVVSLAAGRQKYLADSLLRLTTYYLRRMGADDDSRVYRPHRRRPTKFRGQLADRLERAQCRKTLERVFGWRIT